MLLALVSALICFLMLTLYAWYSMRQSPSTSRSAMFSLCAGVSLGIAVSVTITVGQVNLLKHQRRYLTAGLSAYASARDQVASYDAAGHPLSIPCSRGIEATSNFSANFATSPSWRHTAIYDHSVMALLAYSLYKTLQVEGCISSAQMDTSLSNLRAMQANDAASLGSWNRLLMAAPIGLFSAQPSMRTASRIRWGAFPSSANTADNTRS